MAFTVSSPAMEPSSPAGPASPSGDALARPAGDDDQALARHASGQASERRWRLFRDLAVFQAKLLVDGLKDLVLAPVSLVAAVVGLVLDRNDPGRSFYTVLRWGHGFDRWVNLFGSSLRALPPGAAQGEQAPPEDTRSHDAAVPPRAATQGLDAYVDRLERVLVEQYRRGGLTAKAKDAIDQALDGLPTRKPPPR
jgi:hypothetical protein